MIKAKKQVIEMTEHQAEINFCLDSMYAYNELNALEENNNYRQLLLWERQLRKHDFEETTAVKAHSLKAPYNCLVLVQS